MEQVTVGGLPLNTGLAQRSVKQVRGNKTAHLTLAVHAITRPFLVRWMLDHIGTNRTEFDVSITSGYIVCFWIRQDRNGPS